MHEFIFHTNSEALPHDLSEQEVHIWFAMAPDSLNMDSWKDSLSEEEKSRFKAYKTAGKQGEFLFGRYFLRKTLSLYLQQAPTDIPLSINPHKRPYLVGHNLQFNLTHSFGGFALIVSPSYRVGIDLEYVKRNISLQDGRHVFMPAEIESMAKLDPPSAKDAFLTRWTLKEALYKAVDQGPQLLFNRFALTFDPLRVHSQSSLLQETRWELGTFQPHPDYKAAFAIENPSQHPLQVHCYEFRV